MSRLLSSTTLLEGMEQVGFNGGKPGNDRKRELEEKIQAGAHFTLYYAIAPCSMEHAIHITQIVLRAWMCDDVHAGI